MNSDYYMSAGRRKNNKETCKAYYKAHREESLAKRKIYYQKNRMAIRKRRKDEYAALSIKEKRRIARRMLLRRYSLLPESYDVILKQQRNKCKCCKKKFGRTFENRPCIDHDHKCCTGFTSCGKCIRGLLCSWCNRLIGIVEKNKFLLDYLKGETKW